MEGHARDRGNTCHIEGRFLKTTEVFGTELLKLDFFFFRSKPIHMPLWDGGHLILFRNASHFQTVSLQEMEELITLKMKSQTSQVRKQVQARKKLQWNLRKI